MHLLHKMGVFIVGSSVLLIVGYGAFSSYSDLKQVRAKKGLAVEINKRFPVGSSPSDVLVYLDQKHLEHSPYVPAQRTISAIKRGTSNNLLVTGDVQFVFSFDGSDKLASINFRDIYTGP